MSAVGTSLSATLYPSTWVQWLLGRPNLSLPRGTHSAHCPETGPDPLMTALRWCFGLQSLPRHTPIWFLQQPCGQPLQVHLTLGTVHCQVGQRGGKSVAREDAGIYLLSLFPGPCPALGALYTLDPLNKLVRQVVFSCYFLKKDNCYVPPSTPQVHMLKSLPPVDGVRWWGLWEIIKFIQN